jgi:acetyl-CoA C-acetyltransferase
VLEVEKDRKKYLLIQVNRMNVVIKQSMRRQREFSTISVHSFKPKPVYVIGVGLHPVTRKGNVTLAGMGGFAIKAALNDANINASNIGAIYVGNMLSGILSSQQHLGALLANAGGLGFVESATAEACCGSGGAALRWGYLAISSGAHDTVVVAGVEHMTHVDVDRATKGLATASEWSSEGGKGETFVSLNGAIMTEYMKRYKVPHSAFSPFPITAHTNALTSAHSTLKVNVTPESYESSRVITPPVQLLDASPICDGAAALILTSDKGLALASASARGNNNTRIVQITGSAAATDQLAVNSRPDILKLRAVTRSVENALASSRVTREEIDVFECHDAYSIMACCSIEAAGFAPEGQGTQFAADGNLSLSGTLPIATFGGLKARGHPVGATGIYQACEAHLQLTKRAGLNQVRKEANTVMIQNIGGSGASVFTHIFQAKD